ncbi:MAG TPA: serine hydrolase domain-containing protein, partial [Flavitalea sp.]|nr:serine hydrolase domain-containing protein [Flavitalea sp.]
MSVNKRSFVLFIIILFTSFCRFGYSQTPKQKIEELMSAYADLYKFNGTVLVAEKGKIIFSKGYGLKNAKDSSRNDVNTIYQLGSITKQFTSAIVLQLAEQKKLSLDDRLSKYFPDFPKGDSITIRHL